MKTHFLAHARVNRTIPNATTTWLQKYLTPTPTGKTAFEVLVPTPFTWALLASASVGFASGGDPCPVSSWLRELA